MTQYGIFIEENDKLYLNLILEKIYENTKYDFRNYRESTLFRRISRRLYNSSSINFEQYYNYLDLHSNEYANLIKDLTINVTEFFRDIEYWNSFTSNHIVQIIKNSVSERKNSINIWSAGCASGEEAYSAAILFYDFIKTNNIPLQIKVTGTDISSDHLETAESGIYNCDKIISGFFPEYAKKYLTKQNNSQVSIISEIKKNVEFKFHSLVSENFLKNIDLIICRNVFIYFTRPLQNSIIEKFHSSLNPNGILWLGRAETISAEHENLFAQTSDKIKFYKKI